MALANASMSGKSVLPRVSSVLCPRSWIIAFLCGVPLLFALLGVSMSTSLTSGPTLHLIIEWTSVMFALGVGITSFAQYPITREPVTIVFGAAFMCAGAMDAFHALAAGGLIQSVEDAEIFVPFTWVLSRTFNAVIVSAGAFVLIVKPHYLAPKYTKTIWLIVFLVFATVVSALLYSAVGSSLPQTQFPNAFISRPWDMFPFVVFVIGAATLSRTTSARPVTPFTRALVVSLFVGAAMEAYMAFGSSHLYDHYFIGAHSLKNLIYVVPLLGMLMEYVQTYLHQQQLRREAAVASRFSVAVVSSSKDAIVVTDEEGTIDGVNPAVEQYWGYTSEKLAGISIEQLIESESLGKFLLAKKELLSGESTNKVMIELVAIHSDGTRIPMKLSIVSTVSIDEFIMSSQNLVFTFTDMTELKAEQEQREHANRMLRFLVEGLPEAVVFADAQGEIVGWNSGATEMFGYDAEQAAAISFGDVVPGVLEELQALFEGESKELASFQKRANGIHRTGRSFPISASLSTWSVGGTSAVGALIIDETERQKAEEHLLAAKEEAEAHSRSKSRFFANMSHELRTPLNGISGMAQLLQHSGLDSEQNSYVEILRKSAQSLTHIINDVLDFSKMEANGLLLEEIPFNPSELVREVVDLVKLGSKKSGVEFLVEVAPDTVNVVLGDPFRVRQILMNLMSNAEKFTDQGSISVSLRSNLDGDGQVRLHFAVNDSGPGIAVSARRRIFEAFEQEDVTVTRNVGGTGLGLPICRELTTIMGGRIHCDASESGGSRFRFSVLCKTSSGVIIEEEQSPAMCAFYCRILVAEDNPVNQMVIGAMLKKLGHDYEIVENGKLAYDAVRSGEFTIVLMDCQMPVMGGLEATRRIRQQPWGQTIPILALTAQALTEDRQICLDAGMSDYLTKPINLDTLTSTIEKWAGTWRDHRLDELPTSSLARGDR